MGKDYREMKICCGNCRNFYPTGMDDKGRREGFCDEFPTRVHEDWRCYGEKIPFRPKQDFEEKKGE